MNKANPPGPVGRWGGINHLRAIRADFLEFAHTLHQTHGDAVYYRVFGQQIFQFASPTLAHEVLVGRAKSLHKPVNQKRAFGRIIGNNLFTSDGEQWQTRRRMLAPLFQPQIIDRYRAIVIRQAERVIGQLSSGVVDVSRTAGRITLLAVAEALFGTAIHKVADEFLDVVNRLQGAISRQILSRARSAVDPDARQPRHHLVVAVFRAPYVFTDQTASSIAWSIPRLASGTSGGDRRGRSRAIDRPPGDG